MKQHYRPQRKNICELDFWVNCPFNSQSVYYTYLVWKGTVCRILMLLWIIFILSILVPRAFGLYRLMLSYWLSFLGLQLNTTKAGFYIYISWLKNTSSAVLTRPNMTHFSKIILTVNKYWSHAVFATVLASPTNSKPQSRKIFRLRL